MAIQTKAKLKEFIQRKLGKGVVGVELTDDQLDDAVMLAVEYFQEWVGQCKSVLFSLTTDTEYDGSLIASDIDYVVNVAFPLTSSGIEDVFDWAGVEINPFTFVYGGSTGGYSDIVQMLQYQEMAKRIVSADREWEWDESRDKLIVTPTPTSGEQVLVSYISTDVDLTYLKTYEWRPIRDYALAQAMKTLAAIRMKYSEKPSATGAFAMDGDALWANAEAIEQQVEEKMRSLSEPLGFWVE